VVVSIFSTAASTSTEDIDRMSWTDLGHHGERVGTVPVSSVELDPTRRSALDAQIFDLLE
jgi:hypothetical protein